MSTPATPWPSPAPFPSSPAPRFPSRPAPGKGAAHFSFPAPPTVPLPAPGPHPPPGPTAGQTEGQTDAASSTPHPHRLQNKHKPGKGQRTFSYRKVRVLKITNTGKITRLLKNLRKIQQGFAEPDLISISMETGKPLPISPKHFL